MKSQSKLYNIIFVNNLPFYLKYSGSATESKRTTKSVFIFGYRCKFLNNYELVEFLVGYKRGRPGDGVKSCCMLGPGNFSGDELLSRCLRRPFRKTFFYSY
jgi:hypothetical protein